MTSDYPLKAEDIAEMIAHAIGDAMAWLIRLILILGFCMRLSVVLCLNTLQWWQRRYLRPYSDPGGEFITVDGGMNVISSTNNRTDVRQLDMASRPSPIMRAPGQAKG